MRALLSAIAIVLAIVFPVASNAQAARPQLLHSAHAAVAKAGNAPGVHTQAVPIRFNAQDMLGLRYLDEVELALPNATAHAVLFELAREHPGGIRTWIGHLRDHGTGYRVIVTSGPAGSYGVIDTPEASYRIVPGDGHDWLIDMTQEQLHLPLINLGVDYLVPPASAKSLPAPSAPVEFYEAIPGVNTLATAKVTPPLVTVDLMVVATRGLANRLGANLATRIAFLVDRANTSYADSEVGIVLRLVNVTVVDYTDAGDNGTALNAITNGTGVFAGMAAIRDQYGADMVALLRDGGAFSGSGVAWLPSPATSPYMYSVTTGCVSGCESVFIHELGHNMGNAHDRNTVAWQDGGTPTPGTGLFSYSYGYAFCKSGALSCNPLIPNGSPGGCGSSQPECSTDDPSNFSDIMAYFHATTQRQYKFSSPSVTCTSTGAGTDGIPRPCGTAEANTALSMNNNRATIAAMKATVVGNPSPGSIQFKQSGYSGAETGGTIAFTVSRSALPGAGAVSVNYSVASGTATAGVDFVAAAGTLSWAAGDLADKTFNVTLVNDQATEGVESFTATLSNPAGAAGVYLGHPATATGLILETWPVGGALPAGFLTPDGSSGAWTTATDFAFEGSTSLRSAQVLGPGDFVTFTNSDLSYTAALPAGQMAFAYRVSSYPGYGYLEFLVDGVVVLSDSGETGWKVFFHTLPTAKTYALKWRFKNSIPFNCKDASPPPPGGANCADRAWIDALSLPASLTASTTAVASGTNPANSGQSVTFTATVNPGGFGGTVAFFDGGNPIAACQAQPMVAGTATCTTNALSVGSHSITAGYSGTTAVAASLSGAISQTILGVQTLTVAKAGGGAGTVTSNVGGISCGATCSAPYNAGTTVILTAAASGGSIFAGWSGGGCSGLGTCTVTMNANTTVTATFVTVSGSLALTVTPDPLDLGNQAVGATSAAKTVTIVNTGTGTVTVSGVAVSGAPFARTHSCTTIAAGASCPVSVTFAPTALGAKAGTLTVTSNAANGPHTVNLAGTGVASASFAANVAAVVTGYYETILGRAPDAGGLTFWSAEATRVTGLGADVREVFFAMSMSFFGSAEYGLRNRTDTEFLTDMYRTFFIRDPDGPGLAFWQGELTAVGSRSALLNSFLFSSEFSTQMASIFGSTPVRPELNMTIDLFRGALGRLPDSGGFNFWLGRIRTAQCQGASAVSTEVNSLAALFFQSAEYTARNRVDRDFMGDVYNAFLRRGPGGDSTGFNFWVGQVGTQGRDFVRSQFVPSAEFQARVAQVIAAGCLP